MISAITYNGDGVTRVFPVAFEIKGEEYTVVYVGGVAIADRSLYDIINNSIVFNTAPTAGTNNVEIIVASATTEIADLNAPPSIIQTVLDNMPDILNVSNHSTQIDVVSTNISSVQAVSANAANINTVGYNITGINNVVSQVIPNLSEILLADNNATIATTKAAEAIVSSQTATTKAAEALLSEQNADISETTALSYKNSAESAMVTAVSKASEAVASAVIAGAYANINWAGFSVSDGELIVTYANGLTSTPSLVDGEFIITY